MKSVIFSSYGTAADLRLGDVAKPIPGKNELLIRVVASTVNDWDWGLLRGKPFVNRLLFGMFAPRVKTLGIDVSGVVEAVGQGVRRFAVGDAVMGDLSAARWGAYAEYVCVPTKSVVRKPPGLGHDEAACLAHSGVLAIQSFLDRGPPAAGSHVLVNGAGGGAGTLAIQLLKSWGVNVTAVDKGGKIARMRELGADHVVDYQEESFAASGRSYDMILDMAAHSPIQAYREALRDGGRYVLVGGASGPIIEVMLAGPFIRLFTGKKMGVLAHAPNKYLDEVAGMVAAGKLETTIGARFALEDVPKALELFGRGTCVGKIVIDVAPGENG